MSVSILVVDDEPDVAELSASVSPRGAPRHLCRCTSPTRARQALERLSGDIEPALIVILSDINMPGMDGLQLLGEIKQRWPDLPVMMVTAYGDDERRRRASELGAASLSPSRSISTC